MVKFQLLYMVMQKMDEKEFMELELLYKGLKITAYIKVQKISVE